MRVLFVTSEAYPLAKSGGLADVAGALPAALRQRGMDVRVLLPGYPRAAATLADAHPQIRLDGLSGVEGATLVSGKLPGSEVPVWLVHAPSLYFRNGGLYQDSDGRDWPDNALRFGFLAQVGAALARGLLGNWTPDVVHANDWHCGLLPLLLSMKEGPRPATMFTIHNMAFQGNFPPQCLSPLGIPDGFFHPGGIEFYGQASFLKAGIRYSNRITTVSPAYAREVQTPEFGCGLDGLLRERSGALSGILNGIDAALWNPKTDIHLPRHYGASDIAGKRACKADLQRELGLDLSAETPLIGFVSRLAHQKMADVIADAIPGIVESGAQVAVLGEGEPALETAFAASGNSFPGRMAVRIGYDESLAHRLQAGSDILLAPARYEPCGLTQLYAMRYGTLPIVRRTGGLGDTVKNATANAVLDCSATGIVFDEPNVPGLMRGVNHALALYREPLLWRRLQLQAMLQDFSWSASAARYAALYREIAPHAGLTPEMPEDAIPAASVHAA
ncbi:MAG TPA: glycogen synthase GlgA [Rhizomicrobium sp.]|jgi:starch synthase|nr:glycogen synthase GlgA [Rhizomicrobium sp.]